MYFTRRGWKYWARLLLTALLSSALAVAVTIVVLGYQHATGYLHPQRVVPTGEYLSEHGIKFQSVELVTEDHVRLAAWYTPPQNGAVILVAHGYGVSRPEEFYEIFASHGYGVLAWDFRAHGASGGDFSSLGYYEVLDVKAALDYAKAQPGVEHIGGWGGSMGAATMIRAAARYPEIEAVIADSPFASLKEEINILVPYSPMRFLIQFFARRESKVDPDWVCPIDDIGKISPRPVFIIQGLGDSMVRLDSAQRLYDAAGDPRKLWTEPEVPHLNMYSYYQKKYVNKVINFFDGYLLDK